jgi:hypothetical protein
MQVAATSQRKRRLITLDVAEDSLLRRVSPTCVTPHFGLLPQPFHRVVEQFNEVGSLKRAEGLTTRRHHMDLGFSIGLKKIKCLNVLQSSRTARVES